MEKELTSNKDNEVKKLERKLAKAKIEEVLDKKKKTSSVEDAIDDSDLSEKVKTELRIALNKGKKADIEKLEKVNPAINSLHEHEAPVRQFMHKHRSQPYY